MLIRAHILPGVKAYVEVTRVFVLGWAYRNFSITHLGLVEDAGLHLHPFGLAQVPVREHRPLQGDQALALLRLQRLRTETLRGAGVLLLIQACLVVEFALPRLTTYAHLTPPHPAPVVVSDAAPHSTLLDVEYRPPGISTPVVVSDAAH